MKKILFIFLLAAMAVLNYAYAQEEFPINDLPNAEVVTIVKGGNQPAFRDFSPTDCSDLSQDISIILGQASPNPGSQERVGIQFGRIFRDAIASACPFKVYPGIFNTSTQFGYHAIQFSNCSSEPVCITVNVNVNNGSSPCGTNAHAI